MWALDVSFVRNDASIELSLSMCPCGIAASVTPSQRGSAATLGPGVQSTSEQTPQGPTRVLLAAPRGYCAGVDRAVEAVEHALDLYGEPVYVRKEIVHNKH